MEVSIPSQTEMLRERAHMTGRTKIIRCPECKARRKELVRQNNEHKKKYGVPLYSGSLTIPVKAREARKGLPLVQVSMPECVCDKCKVETYTQGKGTELQRQRQRELESKGASFTGPNGTRRKALKVITRKKDGTQRVALDVEAEERRRLATETRKRKATGTTAKKKRTRKAKQAKKDLTLVKPPVKTEKNLGKTYYLGTTKEDPEFLTQDVIDLSKFGKMSANEAKTLIFENKLFARQLPSGVTYNPITSILDIRVRPKKAHDPAVAKCIIP